MLGHIIENITWSEGHPSVILVDGGVAEILKWRAEKCPKVALFPLPDIDSWSKEYMAFASSSSSSANMRSRGDDDARIEEEDEEEEGEGASADAGGMDGDSLYALCRKYPVLQALFLMSPASILVVTVQPLDASCSQALLDCLRAVAAASKCKEMHIVTTSAGVQESESFDDISSRFCANLFPVRARAHALALSSVTLLSHRLDHCGLFVLSATPARGAAPLTLRSLGLLNNSAVNSINDVLAEDIPEATRKALKATAWQLTNCLVNDLNVDPTGFIFALGKTSKLMGHSVLNYLAEATRERLDGCEDSVKYCLQSASSSSSPGAGSIGGDSKSPLREASLVLIDRTVDVATPASYARPASPLLHHVMATINRLKTSTSTSRDTTEAMSLLDLDVQSQKLLPLLNTHDASNEVPFFTMSGLSSLAVQINPSLAAFSAYIRDSRHNHGHSHTYGASEDDRLEYARIWRAFVSEPEETARKLLCNALRDRITLERGTLPPAKKRGFGAELLAFVQSLIVSPGSAERGTHEPVEAIQSRGFNSIICERYAGLLSLVFCAIESLQRSSSKQFKMHDPVQGTWKACFDVSQTFDARMNDAITSLNTKSTLDAVVMAEIERRLQASAASNKSVSKDAGPASKKEAASAVPAEEPVDLANLMLTIASATNRCGYPIAEEFKATICSRLLSYLLHQSPVEELLSTAWLSAQIISEVTRYRALKQETSNTTTSFTTATTNNSIISSGDEEEGGEDLIRMGQRLELELEGFLELQFDAIAELVGDSKFSYTSTEHLKSEFGLVARLTHILLSDSIINTSHSDSTSSMAQTPLADLGVEHIGGSLRVLAKAGLGLLSYGLNSFGLTSAPVMAVRDPRPADRSLIVLFVVGGVSAVEVAEVQHQLVVMNQQARSGRHGSSSSSSSSSSSTAAASGGGFEIILGSTDVLSPDDVYFQILGSTA